MRILFRFGDNDFQHTFIEVFRVLLRASEDNRIKRKMQSKEYICAMINELAFPMYRVVQDQDFPLLEDGRFSSEEEQRDFYIRYFKATPDMIYLDKEIDALVTEMGDGNRSWFVLDTGQHDPQWRVYTL